MAEVACGALFAPVEEWRTAHFGALWTRYLPDFPLTDDAPPILVGMDGRPHLAASGPRGDVQVPLDERRVWFLSADRERLIQVQRDRFHYNWRRLRDDQVYPRFEAVYLAFRRHFGVLGEFLAPVGGPRVDQYVLTYANRVPVDGARYSEAARVLRLPGAPPGAALAEPDRFRWSAEAPARGVAGGRLRLEAVFEPPAAGGGSAAEGGAVRLRFDIVVWGPAGDASGPAMDDWFDRAHETLVRAFLEFTTDEARAAWRPT